MTPFGAILEQRAVPRKAVRLLRNGRDTRVE